MQRHLLRGGLVLPAWMRKRTMGAISWAERERKRDARVVGGEVVGEKAVPLGLQTDFPLPVSAPLSPSPPARSLAWQRVTYHWLGSGSLLEAGFALLSLSIRRISAAVMASPPDCRCRRRLRQLRGLRWDEGDGLLPEGTSRNPRVLSPPWTSSLTACQPVWQWLRCLGARRASWHHGIMVSKAPLSPTPSRAITGLWCHWVPCCFPLSLCG